MAFLRAILLPPPLSYNINRINKCETRLNSIIYNATRDNYHQDKDLDDLEFKV